MVELLKKGKVGKVIDVQDFDLDAVNSINQTPNHFEMSASQYANPANKARLSISWISSFLRRWKSIPSSTSTC